MQAVVDLYCDEPYGRAEVSLDPVGEFNAVVASSTAQKQRGMIGVTFEDMQAQALLFVEPAPALTAFHNKGVAYPLCVVLFDGSGMLVDQFRLEADDSTQRRPRAPYTYALELPVSEAFPYPPDARLRVSVVGGDPVAQEISPQR